MVGAGAEGRSGWFGLNILPGNFFLFFGQIGIGAEGRFGWFGCFLFRLVMKSLCVPEGRFGWFGAGSWFGW